MTRGRRGGRHRARDRISGSATWHEPPSRAMTPRGVAYPGARPGGPPAREQPLAGPPCPPLPYLSVGSLLGGPQRVHRAAPVLPVTGCAPVARLLHDRCVTCGTSPRGRVADLTAGQLRRRSAANWNGAASTRRSRWPMTDACHAGPGQHHQRGRTPAVLAAHAARRRAPPSWPGRSGLARSGRRAGRRPQLFPLRLRRPAAMAVCAAGALARARPAGDGACRCTHRARALVARRPRTGARIAAAAVLPGRHVRP